MSSCRPTTRFTCICGLGGVMRLFLCLIPLLAPLPAFAVNPDEVLSDPA
ncbi:cytochrome c-type biogenesis protein CcmH, partial [Rhizobium sp. P40RR-XXII]|nr:cytochrome c-type biogenesis protein CcmH [Rhizobium sp. P40RR-XXII]